MNLIYRTVTILGIATVLGGMPLAAFAQPPQSLAGSTNAEEFFYQRVDKVERGNYQGVIADFKQALQINPDYADAYNKQENARAEQNTVGYQQAQTFIQMMQQSPTPHSWWLPPCPEMF